MENPVKLSIITPVCNNPEDIEKCIINVANQNCPYCEHIIIGGSSSEEAKGIIKKYSKKYSHIRWVPENFKRQHEAMNKGVSLARAEVISFLDMSGFYEPNALNYVLEKFKTLPEPSFFAGNCWIHDENKSSLNKPSKLSFKSMLSHLLLNFNEEPSAVPALYFYHKSIHKKVGLYRNQQYCAGLDFILRAAKEVNMVYASKNLGNVIIRGNRKSPCRNESNEAEEYQKLIENSMKRLSYGEKAEVYARSWFLSGWDKAIYLKGILFNLLLRLRKKSEKNNTEKLTIIKYMSQTYDKVRCLQFKVNPKSNKTAFLTETRDNPMEIDYAVRNVMHFLGNSWGLVIFHSKQNEKTVKSLFKAVRGIKYIDVEDVIKGISSRFRINDLLSSPLFWSKIPGEKLLYFQTDALIRRKGINKFLKWDYIGAPWKKEFSGNNPSFSGGGGGLLLHSKSKTIEVLKKYPHIPHQNTDIYFCNNLHKVDAKLAPRSVCAEFSVESDYFCKNPMGLHQIDKYLADEQLREILLTIDYGGKRSSD